MKRLLAVVIVSVATVACSKAEVGAANDLKASPIGKTGGSDDSIKPKPGAVSPAGKGGIPDDGIKPVTPAGKGGIPDDSIKPKPLPLKVGGNDDIRPAAPAPVPTPR